MCWQSAALRSWEGFAESGDSYLTRGVYPDGYDRKSLSYVHWREALGEEDPEADG